MKIYISYYGNYVNIVEGSYNHRKGTYKIKSSESISAEDVNLDINDKYSLLKEAIKSIDSKTKNIVLSLNTRDIIIKSTSMARIEPKYLDGIMNNEIYDIMSLSNDNYTFSYEVTSEFDLEGKPMIDITMAAISNEELNIISNIFKNYKLNLERVDTISTAYSRLMSSVDYEDIMVMDIGSYGSIVNIYKNDSLFIHDNIPIKINKYSNELVVDALIEEIRGLTNFYSSRNYGKTIDTIVVFGEADHNNMLISNLNEKLSGDVFSGIQTLVNLKKDIQGDISESEIDDISSILGSMSVGKISKNNYSYMNLLPNDIKKKNEKLQKIKQGALTLPIVIGLACSPNIILAILQNKAEKDIEVAQIKLDEILIKYKDIEDINKDMESVKNEIEIYDMIADNELEWGKILDTIDKNIPYKVDLTDIDISFDESLINEDEPDTEIEEQLKITDEDEEETPIYKKVPNRIHLEGIAQKTQFLGQFVYNLNQISYFETVKLNTGEEDTEHGGISFDIVIILKEGAVYVEQE